MNFKIENYTSSAKLVYSILLQGSEICHGGVLDDGTFHCMIDESYLTDLRVRIYSPYGLGEDVYYTGVNDNNSASGFKKKEVNVLSYPYVVPIGLNFFISSSISETTTCGGFSIIGETLLEQLDTTKKELANVTCELQGYEEYAASIVYRGTKYSNITSTEIRTTIPPSDGSSEPEI